jgi:hypothetical protein
MQLVKTQGIATLYRESNYFGRANATAEWIVKVGDRVIGRYDTRRAALEWLVIYSV